MTQDGMSVGKRRDRRHLAVVAKCASLSHQTSNLRIDKQTNTHGQKQTNHTTTAVPAQAPKPLCDRLLLGIDQHAAQLRIVRQIDGAGTQPPQRVYPNV